MAPLRKGLGLSQKKKRVVFIDDDIIVLSNIKFISEYYRESPEVIVKYKEQYPRFLDVQYKIHEHKKGKKERLEEERDYKELRDYKDYRDRESKDRDDHKDKKEKFLYEDKREHRGTGNDKRYRD